MVHEAQEFQLTGGIVDENQDATLASTLFEPAMVGSIDLDKLALAFAWLSGGVDPRL